MTYNVLSADFDPDPQRQLAVLEFIADQLNVEPLTVHAICLQEVHHTLLPRLRQRFENCASTDLPEPTDNLVYISRTQFASFSVLQLGPVKQALLVQVRTHW